jgi:hypothetical protein
MTKRERVVVLAYQQLDWIKSKSEENSSKMPNGGTLQPKT